MHPATDNGDRGRDPAGILWLALASWAVIAAGLAAGRYVQNGGQLRPALVYGVYDASSWAPVAALAYGFARWFPLDGRRPVPSALRVAFAALLLTAGRHAALRVVHPLLFPSESGWPLAQAVAISSQNVVLVALLIGQGYAVRFYRVQRERELGQLRLEAQLAGTQLQVLQRQLQPHFLFNALNSVSALMRRDVHAAREMLARVGELLRLAVGNAHGQLVPFEEEWRFTELYLEIEGVRFGERLRVASRIDPAVREMSVPYMLLQPLVENAIRHGIAPREGGGTVEIEARGAPGGGLHLEVRDDGVGLAEEWDGPGAGIGIRTTRARLAQLYGPGYRLELRRRAPRGTLVRAVLPARPLAVAGAA
jgi:two-component system, LytTR family, sensor kinase